MLFWFWFGAHTFQHMTSDSHSMELAPLWQRIAFLTVIAFISIVFFAGMLIYLRFYCTRLVLLAGDQQIRVETLRLFGRHERILDSNRISSTSYHEGKLDTGVFWVPSVDAPWFWVTVGGGRGFILDLQGQFPEAETLATILPSKGPD